LISVEEIGTQGMGLVLKKHIPNLNVVSESCQCRYLLLVGSEHSEDNMFFTNQYFSSYGIAQRSFVGKKNNRLYVSMKMALVDMQTKK